MQSEYKKPIGWPEKQLLTGDKQSDKDREPTYDEGGEEEDDFLLSRDRGETLAIQKSLLAPKKGKGGDGPKSSTLAVPSKKRFARLVLMEVAAITSSLRRLSLS